MINRLKHTIFATLLVALTLTSAGISAQAQRRPVRRAPTAGQDVRAVIHRIENNAALFQNNLSQSNQTNANNGGNINQLAADFRGAVSRLHEDYDARQSVNNDVQTVINFASNIDNYLQRNSLDAGTLNYWASIRPDLNQLSRIYGVPYRTSAQTYPTYNQGNNFPTNNQGNNFPNNQGGYNTNGLTGTYRLNSSRSDNAADAANRATQTLPYRDRQAVRDNLVRRLESPDALAIDVRGRSVTIASSRAPQFTFDADGRERTEQTQNGRTIRASASLYNNQLIVNSVGDRTQDYSVTFDALEGGRRLRVTRRVSSERLQQPVVVQSFYDKTADVAQFNIYNGSQQQGGYNNNNNTTAANTNEFVIPNDTQLVAVLNENVSTKTSREGDRFTMTVRDPSQYNGAIIEGSVARVNPSGRVTGRSQLSLNFERIRFNGNSYNFAGIISSIRTQNGEDARVDNEGTVQDSSSQTTKTEQRAAIGTGLGAIIGAIAGGGKGAVIGAVLGAGGGAGSVYAQGRNDLDLMSGTEVTIRASAPSSFGR